MSNEVQKNEKGDQPQFRVLCVDDNRDSADSLALLLQVMGFETQACYDGETAIALNQFFHPGLCFIDLNMPGMDGDEVAKKVLSSDKWHPLLVVALTAKGDALSRERTSAAGFHMHLVKPVDMVNIIEVVNRLFKASEHSH